MSGKNYYREDEEKEGDDYLDDIQGDKENETLFEEDEVESNNVYSGEHSDLRRDQLICEQQIPVDEKNYKIPSVMGNVGNTNPIPYPLNKEKRRIEKEIREKEMKLREVQEEIRLKEQESERLKKEIQLLSSDWIDDNGKPILVKD